ncbi:hypothetical protein L1887_14264 [Cichorium endivia]|nr:hypothetical protein L1887_14264 [Cichorium endivia]
MPLIRRISDAMFSPYLPHSRLSHMPDINLYKSIDVVSEQIESFEVVNEFPHDAAAFTQGLLYGGNDTLLESNDLNGHVSVDSSQISKIHIL